MLQAKPVLPLVRLLGLLVPLQVLLVPLLVPLALPQVLLARQVPPPLALASSPPLQSLVCRLAPWQQLAQLSRQLPSPRATTATAPRRTTDRVRVALRHQTLRQKQGGPGYPGLFFFYCNIHCLQNFNDPCEQFSQNVVMLSESCAANLKDYHVANKCYAKLSSR